MSMGCFFPCLTACIRHQLMSPAPRCQPLWQVSALRKLPPWWSLGAAMPRCPAMASAGHPSHDWRSISDHQRTPVEGAMEEWRFFMRTKTHQEWLVVEGNIYGNNMGNSQISLSKCMASFVVWKSFAEKSYSALNSIGLWLLKGRPADVGTGGNFQPKASLHGCAACDSSGSQRRFVPYFATNQYSETGIVDQLW